MLNRAFAFLSLAAILFSSLSVSAQKRGGTVASAKAPAAAKCSGAWTGSITFTRTQTLSDNKTIPRVSGRGQDTRDWQMNYSYSAQISVIESPERNGSSIGRATISHTMSSVEKVDAVEQNSCDHGKTWKDMRGTSTSRTDTAGNDTVEANVNIGVNSDGTYSVSVGLPQIKGKVSGSMNSTFSGQCTPKEGKNFSMPPSETTVDGHSLTSDGTTRINPGDPNRISGSYSLQMPGVAGVVETISWNLQKCGAPLRINDLKFQDMKFPTWNSWRDISEQVGTIDGNLVKIKATVLNTSGETKSATIKLKETYKGDKWDGARPDGILPNGDLSVTVPPGESKDVEMIWDSSGYAWFDDGRPRLVQRIRAELEEAGKKTDEMTKNLKVAPKPVVLVHGLWSNWHAWESWQNIFTTSHSYDWKAFAIGEKREHGEMNTGGSFLSTTPTKSIEQNARVMQAYVRYAREDRNAWHIDVVAHSMGGLISRYYIHNVMDNDGVGKPEDGRPAITHLVMLGTPNQGSPCADVMNTAFEVLGKDVEAMRQLTTESVRKFNGLVFNRKGVKFSGLAGNPLPNTCKQLEWNDGVVTVPSAKYNITDTAETKSLHTDMTGTSDFSSFVKPRLAIGPKGNHKPEPPNIGGGVATNNVSPAQGFYPFDPATLIASTGLTGGMFAQPFAKSVNVAPHQSAEVEIPVEPASDFGMTFMADPKISVTLLNDRGEIVGKNLTDSAESRAWFRSIYIATPVTGAKWKLKIENTGDFEYPVVLTTWATAR
jgi:pimeloyl-ACP methyl ester carboxylesterase